MNRLSNYIVRPARRAGRTISKGAWLYASGPLLAAVMVGSIAALTVLPGLAVAKQTTNDEQAEEAAEIRVTGGCITVVGEDERLTVGPNCDQPRGEVPKEGTEESAPDGLTGGDASSDAGPVAEQPDNEPGFSQELSVPETSARKALEGLVEECEEERESAQSAGDDALYSMTPDKEKTTKEPTTDNGQLSGEDLSPEECEALLDVVSSDGETTDGETTTSEDNDLNEDSTKKDSGQGSDDELERQDNIKNPNAAATGAASAQDFVDSVGVNTHINYTDTAYGDYDLVKNKLEALGVKNIRDKAHLGDEDFNEKIYSRYQDLNDSAGIKTNLIVDPREQGLQTIDAEKVDRIHELSGESLATLEGPNELDIAEEGGDWPQEMRAYQQDLFAGVNDSSAPDTPVLSASLAHARKAGELGDMSDVMDAGNMHPYPGGGPPTEDLEDYNVDNTRRIAGEKPLVATETGYHTAEDGNGGQAGVSEAAEAKYLPRMFLEYFNRGIARSFSYELLDQRPDPSNSDQEENFGLVRADGTDKPAYTALANLISLLDDSTADSTEDAGQTEASEDLDYSVSGNTDNVNQTALYKQDGTFYLVLWQEVESYDAESQTDIEVPAKSITVGFEGALGEATIYLPSESSGPTERYAAGKANQLELAVPDHPIVVEIEPASGSESTGSTEEESSGNETVDAPAGDIPMEDNSPENNSPENNSAQENSVEGNSIENPSTGETTTGDGESELLGPARESTETQSGEGS